jgi:CRM1 C terminal
LIETYVEKADDLEMVRTNIVPALLDAVLVDYNRNVPNARDAEVLKVMSTIITKLSVRWTPHRSKYSVVHPLAPSKYYYFYLSNTSKYGLLTSNYSLLWKTKSLQSWKMSLSVRWR